jgi:hypothetical protein
MSWRYSIFGVPKTLEEFLDREKERYSNPQLRVRIEEKIWTAIRIYPKVKETLYVTSLDRKREFQVSAKEGSTYFYRGSFTNSIPEAIKGIEEDGNRLIDQLRSLGYQVIDERKIKRD